jgi:hypothetical protein
MFRSPKILGLIALLVGLSAIDARAQRVADAPSEGAGVTLGGIHPMNRFSPVGPDSFSYLQLAKMYQLVSDPNVVSRLLSYQDLFSQTRALDPMHEAYRQVAESLVAAVKNPNSTPYLSPELQTVDRHLAQDVVSELENRAAEAKQNPTIQSGVETLGIKLQSLDNLGIGTEDGGRFFDESAARSSGQIPANTLTTGGLVIAAAFPAGSQNIRVQPAAVMARLHPASQLPQRRAPLPVEFRDGVAAPVVDNAFRELSQPYSLNQRVAAAGLLVTAIEARQPAPARGKIERLVLYAQGRGALNFERFYTGIIDAFSIFIGVQRNPASSDKALPARKIAPAAPIGNFSFARPRDPVNIPDTGLRPSGLVRRVLAKRSGSHIPQRVHASLLAAAEATAGAARFTLKMPALLSRLFRQAAHATTSYVDDLPASRALRAAFAQPVPARARP